MFKSNPSLKKTELLLEKKITSLSLSLYFSDSLSSSMYLSTQVLFRKVALDCLLVCSVCLYMYGNLERNLLGVSF
jgi:hypothetical protein